MKYHTSNRSWWVRLPMDLVLVLGFVLLANLAFLLELQDPVVRVAIGLPLLFFLPGYALVAMACPAAPTIEDDDSTTLHDRFASAALGHRGVDVLERLALSFGLSVALLPLLSLVAATLPGGFEPWSLFTLLTAVVAACSVLAAVRRWQLPEDQRYRPRFWTWGSRLRTALFGSGSLLASLVNVVLALSILLALTTMTYGLAVPTDGERYSRLSVLAENDDGELVMSDYPREFTRGESRPLVVAVENREQRRQAYTVVVELQEVRTDGDAAKASVVESEEIARMPTTLEDDETWRESHAVTPTMTGENLRLTYYLYKGEAPADPSVESADEYVFLWVDVSDGDGRSDS